MIRKQYQDDHTKICSGHDKVVKARVEMINSLKINTKRSKQNDQGNSVQN